MDPMAIAPRVAYMEGHAALRRLRTSMIG